MKLWENYLKISGKQTKKHEQSPCLMGKLTISMIIFISYVSLTFNGYSGWWLSLPI